MELTGERLLPIPRDRVWSALLDAETLRAAIPGCEFVTDEGNGIYAVGVLAAVGPVKARFKGRLQQQDVQPPNRYTLSFEGDGGLAGFAKGSAEVELLEEGEAREHTRLKYLAQAQIGGKLAQIGSRLIDATAAKMSAQFFDRLTLAITTPAGVPAAAEVAAPAGARPGVVATPVAAQATPGMVTIQMPAWAWAFTMAALTALAALIGLLAIN